MTICRPGPYFTRIARIIDPVNKIVKINPAWPTGQAYTVTMFLEGTNAGLIEDITYTFSYSKPSLAQGPAYAANNGVIRRAHIDSPATNLAGQSVGYRDQGALTAVCSNASTGLWTNCATDAPIAPGVTASTYYVAPIDNGTTFINTGATGAWSWFLPPAIPGMRYCFSQFVTQIWQIYPASGNGINVQTRIYCPASPGGAFLVLVCRRLHAWETEASLGTWSY